jgi:hypothetical protein
MKKWWLISIFIAILLALAGAFFYFNDSDEKTFEVNSLLVKTSLRQGDLINNQILITNTADVSQKFVVSLSGLKGFGFINETDFVLNPKGFKEVIIYFKNYSTFTPAVYTGELIISGEDSSKIIPVIVELQTSNILFATTLEVSPVYETVLLGERFSGVVRILNLNGPGKHLINVVSSVKDLSNKIIVSESEEIGIENELVYTKTMLIPEHISQGKYIFSVEVNYKDSTSISSHVFNVSKEKAFEINYLVVLIFLFLFAILFLVYFVFKERNNLFLELEKQHRDEMHSVLSNINTCKKAELSKTGLSIKKKDINNKYNKIIEKTRNELREKQKKQDEIFKKLKKENKEDEMKSKLSQWKKEGYNTSVLESKLFKGKDIKNKIKEYKKLGYNVDMFKK